MRVVDLTAPIKSVPKRRLIPLKSAATQYTGVVFDVAHDSMQGSYIDLPGHIAETDDGRRADTVDLADFYQLRAAVGHLNFADGGGAVTAADLEKAFGGVPESADALIINALGKLPCSGIALRSVWLDADAVEWILASGVRLLVSDVYESPRLEGVFLKLFGGGIATVCEPANLWKLTARRVALTVLFPKYAGVTQLSCCVVAEF